MKGYIVYMMINCVGALHAADQGLTSPRQSPNQDSLHQPFSRESSLKSVRVTVSEKPKPILLSGVLEGVPNTLAKRVRSATAVCVASSSSRTSIAESDLSQRSQEYCALQTKIDSFRRSLARSKEQQQEEFDSLTQEVRRVKGSFSGRPFNDDLGSELMGMLLIIGEENQHLRVNPVVKVPSLRLESQSSLDTTSSQGEFSLRKHTDLARNFSQVVDYQGSQISKSRGNPFMLEDAYVDKTVDSARKTSKAAAVLEISDNSDDDSPVMAPLKNKARGNNVVNNDEGNLSSASVGEYSQTQRGQSLCLSVGNTTSNGSGSVFRLPAQGLGSLDDLLNNLS